MWKFGNCKICHIDSSGLEYQRQRSPHHKAGGWTGHQPTFLTIKISIIRLFTQVLANFSASSPPLFMGVWGYTVILGLSGLLSPTKSQYNVIVLFYIFVLRITQKQVKLTWLTDLLPLWTTLSRIQRVVSAHFPKFFHTINLVFQLL